MCVSPYIALRSDGKPVCVPCGKCIECRKDYQNEWIFRLSQEMKRTQCPIFLTLTYNDEHLPIGDGDEGVESVLCKSDVQKFLKRLRKNGGELLKDCRYYCIGEYGSKFNRCHYHLVIIAPNILSVQQFQPILDKSWTLGFSYAKYCTPKQVHYVCKYMNKLDKRPHLVKPFRLFSRSIGLNFLTDEMVRYYLSTFDRTCLNGKFRISLPRYYRKKLDELSSSNFMLKKAGLTYSDLLGDVRVNKKNQYYYFKQFEDNFDFYYRLAYREIAHNSWKYGYQVHEPSRQEVYASYAKANAYLTDLVRESDRLLNSCVIRNKLSGYHPISPQNIPKVIAL